MIYIHFFAALFLCTSILIYKGFACPEKLKSPAKFFFDTQTIIIFLLLSFLTRLIIALLYTGHTSDFASFFGWASRVSRVGFANFYDSNAFTDYPPGYMYILFCIGKIITFFQIPYQSIACVLVIKLPAILCDIFTGYFIYQVAQKKLNSFAAFMLAISYIFNPVIVLNSTIWAQVDSVFTLFVILMCYALTEKKHLNAILFYTVGVLIKPQTLIFTPVLIFSLIDVFTIYSNQKGCFSKRRAATAFIKIFFWCYLGALTFIAFALPFGIHKVVMQYLSTIASYGKASVNAYNIWTLFGLNWHSQSGTFLKITYEKWGYASIVLTMLISSIMYYLNRNTLAKNFLVAAQIIIGIFLFSVRMHERYLFPALILLLFTFIYSPKKELFFSYIAFSIVHFYNTAHVLFFYDSGNFNWQDIPSRIISGATVLVFCFFIFTVIRVSPLKRHVPKFRKAINAFNDNSIRKIEKRLMTKTDYIFLSIIVLLYSCVVFHDIGYKFAPQTTTTLNTNETIECNFNKSVKLSFLSFYLGNNENRNVLISYKENQNGGWINLSSSSTPFTLKSVFKWEHILVDKKVQSIKIQSLSDKNVLNEIVFIDENGLQVAPSNAKDYPSLFDEPLMYDANATFRTGTYFDEIYYARTAYEFDNGLITYESTHPPLGKILIMWGMKIFGVNPFGWRFMSALFGIASLYLIYVFAKKIFDSSFFAVISSLLFFADFMPFVQSRIATLDTFAMFFILGMYFFMYIYTQMSFYTTKLRKTLIPLCASGIMFGLATAVKLTGIYAGLGIAILFFAQIFKRYREYKDASDKPQKYKNQPEYRCILDTFIPNTALTLIACIGFFIIIPFIIYTLSYIHVENGYNQNLIEKMIASQKVMLSYHSSIIAEHPFASRWYQWPLMITPMWYYSNGISATHGEGITSFGNPLIWWIGIPAFLCMIFLALKDKDSLAGFFIIAILSQYLPWILIKRITFIYHYFPVIPFLVLTIAYIPFSLRTKKLCRPLTIMYVSLCLLLFGAFYPVLSGKPVEKTYVTKYLQWMPNWYFIAR
ncbi:MAG: glycosyltransferase family 39 protein [Treponemataceae bacterium]